LPIYNLNTKTPSQLRDEFARWLTSPQNPRFATNIANRIWKKAFGLGVIEPVNDIDDLTEASSPELMAHLTFVMKAAKFDLREVQRVIYNSKTYQASASATPDLGKAKYLFNGPLVRRLSAEQVWDSLIVTAVGTYADNVLLRRGDDLKAMALPAGKVTLAELKNAVNRTTKAFSGGGKLAGAEAHHKRRDADGQVNAADAKQILLLSGFTRGACFEVMAYRIGQLLRFRRFRLGGRHLHNDGQRNSAR
jgi:hypothetical protein